MESLIKPQLEQPQQNSFNIIIDSKIYVHFKYDLVEVHDENFLIYLKLLK